MRILSTLAVLAALSAAARGQPAGPDTDHAAHHPQAASTAASAPQDALPKAQTKAKPTARKPNAATAAASSTSGGMHKQP